MPGVDAMVFAREFLRSPLDTASVVPSSAVLCRELTAPVPESGDPVVVELGPGTGVVTAVVQERLGRRGRHLAVELNPRFADALSRRFPAVEVLCADARALPELLARRGLRADVVLSGLPWAAFQQGGDGDDGGDDDGGGGGRDLPAVLAATMAPGGALTQIGYAVTRRARPARRQLADLRAAFEEVTTSRTVWSNVPPAVVHVARRPRRAPAA